MSYEYFIETASSHREAEELVHQKYGGKAKITEKRQIQKGGFLGIGRKDLVEVRGFVSLDPIRRYPPLPMAGKRSFAYASNAPSQNAEAGDLDAAKQGILKAAGHNDSVTMNKILAEVKNLRDDVQKSRDDELHETEQPPAIQEVQQILEENEFSPKFMQYIHEKCRSLSMEQLDDSVLVQQKVLDWIAESISIRGNVPRSYPRVMVLIGPTGVGKTTTIAKLAGLYRNGKIDGKEHSVRIIATDHYRIGALKQIETYAQIMQVPLESASTSDELKKWLAMYKDADMIFIDTPGRSPSDFENIAKLNTFLQVCGAKSEMYLTLSACTRSSDIRRIMQQFEPFNFASVIVTKTDEAISLGTVISILWEKHKEVSYVSYGQSVPNDLQIASVRRFLQGLTGFQTPADKALT